MEEKAYALFSLDTPNGGGRGDRHAGDHRGSRLGLGSHLEGCLHPADLAGHVRVPGVQDEKKGQIVQRLTFSPKGNLTQAGFDVFVNKQKNIIVFRFNTDVLGTPFTFKTKYRPVGSKVTRDVTFKVASVSRNHLKLTAAGRNKNGLKVSTPEAPFVPREGADSPV
jgi:hypothetical protein